MSRIAKLIISILIPLVVGFTSSFFTASGVSTWFQTIEKPSWNPPNWVFALVWTSLYILMGISLFLIWKNKFDQQKKRTALILFAFQLLLNFLWSFIFFWAAPNRVGTCGHRGSMASTVSHYICICPLK